jgi:hypothetical protein
MPPTYVLVLLYSPGIFIIMQPFLALVLLARHYDKPLVTFLLDGMRSKTCTTPLHTYIKTTKGTPKRCKKRGKKGKGKGKG